MKTDKQTKRYFVDMMVGGQLYAVSVDNGEGVRWTRRTAHNRANELNARKHLQLDQPKAWFQVRATR